MMNKRSGDVSAELASLLRQRRRQLKLSLRDVEKRSVEFGTVLPYSTLAKIEQGKVDPGVRRLHLLMRLYNLPISMAADVLEIEELACELPRIDDASAAYREGVDAWQRGDTDAGLAYLMALRRFSPTSEQETTVHRKALVFFGIMAGSLGKYRLSLQIMQDMLTEPLERDLLVPVLLESARAWNGLGSPEAALAFIMRAETHAAKTDYKWRSWIHHARAGSLEIQGHISSAMKEIERSMEFYRKAGDSYGEGRGYGLLVRLCLASSKYQEAMRWATEGLHYAQDHGYQRLRIHRLLDIGRVRLEIGEPEAALEILEECLGEAISRKERGARCYAHYHLSRAQEMLGNGERAALEMQEARYFVRYIDEDSDETREILAGLRRKESA